MSNILLTGGSGDLGHIVGPQLQHAGHTSTVLDLRAPRIDMPFIQASITDMDALKQAVRGQDMIVHIAAWHGIHEAEGTRDVYDFWRVNVEGTFNVFQAAAEEGIEKIVFLSSTSVKDRHGVYGHTKVLGEEIALTYAKRHNMDIITLRPRAFIPHWNRDVYDTYIDWVKWFWRGAVHIDDVAQAVVKSVAYLQNNTLNNPLTIPLDGAYEYTDTDLAVWDVNGPGTTFKKHYAHYYDLALQHGLDPSKAPKKLPPHTNTIGYVPQFSLKNVLEDLAQYGSNGPPAPDFIAQD